MVKRPDHGPAGAFCRGLRVLLPFAVPAWADVVCDAQDRGKRHLGHRGGAGHGEGFQVLQGATGKLGGRFRGFHRCSDAEGTRDISAG